MRRPTRLTAIGLAVCATVALEGEARASEVRFVFGGRDVQVVGREGAMSVDTRVRLGEAMPVPELFRRFGAHRVILGEECEGFCATVKYGDDFIQLFYGQKSGMVEGIVSWSNAATDINGNRIGARLVDANRTNRLACDVGEVTTCRSAVIQGLEYAVEGCQFWVSNGKRTTIPSCAKIGAFRLWE